MALSKQIYAGSRFALDVDGMSAGYLSSFQVPSYEAEDATSSLGPDYTTKKMLGGPKIGEASAVFNISQSNGLLQWMASLWKKDCRVANTSVHLANQDYKILRSVDMADCLITAIEFPDLKASDGKKTLDVTAKWKPADISFTNGGGSVSSVLGQKAKAWMVANFEVHTAFGLNMNAVMTASLPKISAKVADEKYGETRLGVPMYAAIEFSSIKLEFGAQGAAECRNLAQRIIRDGNVSESNWEDILIDMKDQSLKTTLGTFTMIGCMLKKFDWAPKLEGGKDSSVSSTLEFLCEDFRFEIKHK